MTSPIVCSNCGSGSFTEDAVEGLTCCEGCGLVLSTSNCFSNDVPFFGSQPAGLFVGANDDGTWAAHQAGGGEATQRSRQEYAKAKAIAELRQGGGRLGLSQMIVDEAERLLHRVLATFREGNVPRRAMDGALLFMAGRMGGTPVYLGEVASMAGVDKSYLYQLCKGLADRLGMAIPPLDIESCIKRAIGRIPSLSTFSPRERLLGDTKQLVEWWRGRGRGSSNHLGDNSPTCTAAASLLLVSESHEVAVSLPAVAGQFCLAPAAVQRALNNICDRLVQVAEASPWLPCVTPKTVALHLVTLLRVARLLDRAHPPPLAAPGASHAAQAELTPTGGASHAVPANLTPPACPPSPAAPGVSSAAHAVHANSTPAVGPPPPAAPSLAHDAQADSMPPAHPSLSPAPVTGRPPAAGAPGTLPAVQADLTGTATLAALSAHAASPVASPVAAASPRLESQDCTVASASGMHNVASTSRKRTVASTSRKRTVASTSRKRTVASTSRKRTVASTSRKRTVASTSRKRTALSPTRQAAATPRTNRRPPAKAASPAVSASPPLPALRKRERKRTPRQASFD